MLSEVPTGHQAVNRTHALPSEVPTTEEESIDRSGNSPAGTHSQALGTGHFLISRPAIPVLPLPGREQGHDGSAARASCAEARGKEQSHRRSKGLCLLSTC